MVLFVRSTDVGICGNRVSRCDIRYKAEIADSEILNGNLIISKNKYVLIQNVSVNINFYT